MFSEIIIMMSLNKTVIPPMNKIVTTSNGANIQRATLVDDLGDKRVVVVGTRAANELLANGYKIMDKNYISPDRYDWNSQPLKYFKQNNTNVIASNKDMLPADCSQWGQGDGDTKKGTIRACVKYNDNEVILNTGEDNLDIDIQHQLNHEFAHKIVRDKKLNNEAIELFGDQEQMAEWYSTFARNPGYVIEANKEVAKWFIKNFKL